MRYFSAESQNGSSSSYGFANDTKVLAFSSRAFRDKYVDESTNLSCKAILASDATSRATNVCLTNNRYSGPKRFSGEYWGIYSWGDLPAGCIGTLTVCGSGCPDGDRFYK